MGDVSAFFTKTNQSLPQASPPPTPAETCDQCPYRATRPHVQSSPQRPRHRPASCNASCSHAAPIHNHALSMPPMSPWIPGYTLAQQSSPRTRAQTPLPTRSGYRPRRPHPPCGRRVRRQPRRDPPEKHHSPSRSPRAGQSHCLCQRPSSR